MTPRVALFLPSLDGGGAERVFVELANEFARRGLRVDLVLAMEKGAYLSEVSHQVRIVGLTSHRLLRALPKLAGYLRRERPEAILSALDHANVVAILARGLACRSARCVVSARSMPSGMYAGRVSTRSRLLLRLARATYRHADAVVANSHAVARDVKLHLGVAAESLFVIYNPINLEWIDAMSREDVAHRWFAEGAPPVILSAGRLSAEKDFGTLIRAFAQVRSRRDCRLLILGEGPDRPGLAGLAREVGVERDFEMPGFIPNPIAWMRRARVFVSSSVTEGLPNVVMQALALGLPVVSTRSAGGVAELLGEGRWGTLVPVGDASAMAKAIAANLDASHDIRVRARAMDFAPSAIASQYIELLLPADGAYRQSVAGPESSGQRGGAQA